MHVGGITVDLNWLLQFVFTAFVIAFGILHLVRNAASKYFEVDASFESSGDRRGGDGGVNHDAMHVGFDASCCANCGAPGDKQCSRCKSVRYCSAKCQLAHWRSGHNSNCRVNLKRTGGSPSSIALVPSSRRSKITKKPGEVLFPYEEFVRLYNSDKSGFPPCGLINCGNSCFANVVLQCLTYTKPLIAYLLERGHRGECKRDDWCFLCVFQAHVERASQDSQPFSPINILSRLPNIGGNLGYGRQEDAHEFMRFAIDTMQSVCLDEFGGVKAVDPTTQETTLIQHIFGGHLQSQVICTKCNKISDQFENMMDLTVEIHGDASSLEECLDQYTGKEWLHGDNMYKCDGCNGYVKAWKRLTIRRAPNTLTIALKRFQSGRFGKLNKRVTFPETLDLSPYMSEGGDGTDIYRLYAVVVHVDMLNASFFGHYICYTKDSCGNWYRVNDCKVARVEVEEVLSQSAYMLLYSRVSVRPYSLRVIEPLKEKQQTVQLKLESCTEKVDGNQVLGSADTMSTSTSVMPSENSSEVTRETFEDVKSADSSSAVPESISCESEISFRVGLENGSDAMDVDVSNSSLCTSAQDEVPNCVKDLSVAFNIGSTSDDPERRNVIVCNSTPSQVIGVSCLENNSSAAMDSTSVLIEYSHDRDSVNSEPRSTAVKDDKVNGAVIKNMEANSTIVDDIKSNGAIVKDVEDNVPMVRENGVKSGSINQLSSEANSIKTCNLKGGLAHDQGNGERRAELTEGY